MSINGSDHSTPTRAQLIPAELPGMRLQIRINRSLIEYGLGLAGSERPTVPLYGPYFVH